MARVRFMSGAGGTSRENCRDMAQETEQ